LDRCSRFKIEASDFIRSDSNYGFTAGSRFLGPRRLTNLDYPCVGGDCNLQSPHDRRSSAAPSGGRLKQHVVEKKKDEYKDYVVQIKALIQQYVPPDKDMLEQAFQKGSIALGPAGGEPGQFKLVLTNYIKQGDNMTLVFDRGQKALVGVSIASYLSDPKDAVNVIVGFAGIPGGPGHVASQSIDGVSKQLTIAIANSNYQHL
jgi:hypothetical protein